MYEWCARDRPRQRYSFGWRRRADGSNYSVGERPTYAPLEITEIAGRNERGHAAKHCPRPGERIFIEELFLTFIAIISRINYGFVEDR